MEFHHIPVLKNEVIDNLNIISNGTYIDCTAGGGGHLLAISEQLKTGRIYGFDQDIEAIEYLKNIITDNITLIHSNFKNVKKIMFEKNIQKVNGILIDLGVSTYQLKNSNRGFSFLNNGPLDMRMDKTIEFSASDIVNSYSKEKLLKIIREYGEEKNAFKIVNEIIRERKVKKIETTLELVSIIEKCFPYSWKRRNKIHFATRTFQALRIETNNELEILKSNLDDLIDLLEINGRIAVISFHSLEDRIIKNIFKYHAKTCVCHENAIICNCNKKKTLNIITKKPILSENREIEINPASRSAKLRVAEKI